MFASVLSRSYKALDRVPMLAQSLSHHHQGRVTHALSVGSFLTALFLLSVCVYLQHLSRQPAKNQNISCTASHLNERLHSTCHPLILFCTSFLLVFVCLLHLSTSFHHVIFIILFILNMLIISFFLQQIIKELLQ